jgi:multicomponent Na+:H+ antiporter subunit B
LNASGHAVEMILLTMLVVTAIAIARQRSLMPAVMLTGIFSLLGAGWMLVLDAPDVAFTEAAVGAGISTILFLATLSVTSSEEKNVRVSRLGLFAVFVMGAVLAVATLDMPREGDPNSPANRSPITRVYIHSATNPDEQPGEHAPEGTDGSASNPGEYEVGIPNTVTTVLASFRGYDTMGETAVIFTAGFGVVMILRGARRRRFQPSPEVDITPHREDDAPS